MYLTIARDVLYKYLQKIVKIIEKKPKLPILSHILLNINKNHLLITSTNLELEILAQLLLDKEYLPETITIPGLKFFNICRNLPKHSQISITLENDKVFIKSDNSNFSLSTISSLNFPKTTIWHGKPHIIMSRSIFKKMIDLTQFSMAYQDTRFYLNGMLFETAENMIRMVASDGCRLAMTEITTDVLLPSKSVIISRKGVIEFSNLLNINQETVNIQIYDNYFCIKINDFICSSKLIDGRFPNYLNVFPRNLKNFFEIDRIILKSALKRVAILSNLKLRIVNFYLTLHQLKITTINFEQEKAEEILKITYFDINFHISFNIDYLLEIINTIDTQFIKFFFTDIVSSVQIEGIPKCCGATYIIMPIRV